MDKLYNLGRCLYYISFSLSFIGFIIGGILLIFVSGIINYSLRKKHCEIWVLRKFIMIKKQLIYKRGLNNYKLGETNDKSNDNR